MKRCSDPLMQLVHEHEVAGVGAFLYKAAQHAASTLGLNFSMEREDLPPNLRAQIKNAENRVLLQQHKDKPMHGLFYKHVEDHGLSKELTFTFLKSAALKSETEGFILACQDGVINTLSYRSRVMNVSVPDISCRVCHRAPETLMHILSACSVHAAVGYIHRHNAALRVLYYHLRHSYGIDRTPVLPYVPGEIESVVENEKGRIYWNYSFSTTRLLTATKPDIVLLDKSSKAIYVVEFSAPAECNIVAKEEEKQIKYQELLVELRRLNRGYSVRLIVLVIGVLGGVRPSLLSNLKSIPACEKSAISLLGQMQKAVCEEWLHRMLTGCTNNRAMNQPRFEVLSWSFNVDTDWFNMVSPTPSNEVDWIEFAKGIGIVCHISSSACDSSYSGQLVKVSGVILLIGFGSWLCCKLLKLYSLGTLGDAGDSTNESGHTSFNSFLKTCYFGPANLNEDGSNSVSSQNNSSQIRLNEKHDHCKRHSRYERCASVTRNGNFIKAPKQASLFQRIKFLVSPDSFNGKSTTDSSRKSSPMCSAQLSSFSSPIFCKPSYSSDSFLCGRENSIDSISELSYEVESASATVARLDLLQEEIDQIKYNCLSMDQDFITIKCNRNLPGLSNLIESGEDNISAPTSEEIQKARTCFKGLYSLTTINRSISLDLTDTTAMSDCSVKVSSIEEEALPSLEWDELDDPTSFASQMSDKISSGVFSKPCDSMESSQVLSETYDSEIEPKADIQRSVSYESAVAMSESFSSTSVSAMSSPDCEIVIENIGPKLDILSYASSEWKGQTEKAETILKGYYEAARNLGFNNIRRIRGDNYCAVRAATFQVLTHGIPVPKGEHVYERLTNSSASSFLDDWCFSRLPQYSDNRLQGIRQCLLAFDQLVEKLESCEGESKRSIQLQHLLNSNPQIDLLVMEAVKLFMLDKAIALHSQMASGEDTPLYAILLFSRDACMNPQDFVNSYLAKVGDTGGLEMVEMFLLGDALGVTLKVIRPSAFGTDSFICFYPDDMPTTNPQVTLISEDDRHYNILVN